MSIKKVKGSSKKTGLCKLLVGNEMSIYQIEQIKHFINQELDNYKKFELNLSSVEEFDSAGVQLLLALRNELSREEKQLKLLEPSGVVTKLLECYAIAEHFETEEAA